MTSAPVLLLRRLTAEFPGSAFLAAVVIGSGIAAQFIGGVLAAGVIKALYPGATSADAADIIVPHDSQRGRVAHDGASPSADRPPVPVQPH